MTRIANENNELIDWENEMMGAYRYNRNFYLNFLKMLIKRFSFKDSIFFLAVKYMDTVILSNPNLNHQLVAFSSFLLAGILFI
jgi:hypothetical protein